MTKPTILVTRKLPDTVEEVIAKKFDARLNIEDRLYNGNQLVEFSSDADAIIACHTERFTSSLIDRLPSGVRAIANMSVGVDHVDLTAATNRGIIVTNTPGVLTDATAEITMLLILGAARRASEGERLIRSGEWDTWSPTFMLGTQVTGKRIGIVGMGGVGLITAKRARGFDMEVHYHNRQQLSTEDENGAIFHDTLESLLPVCDFLALHCPATPETEKLLDTDVIAQLPDGAIIVNAARGSVVDEDALIDALRSGKLAAAGLDVYNNEPNINPEFAKLPNVFLLPHLGSATRETRDAMGLKVVENLDAIFAGHQPPNRVA